MTSRILTLIVAAVVAIAATVGLRSQQSPVVVRSVPADVAAGNHDRIQLSVAAATARNEQATRLCESEINMILAREFPELALRESTVTLATELAQMGPSQSGQPVNIAVDVRTSGDLDQALRNLGLSGGVLAATGGFDVVAIMNTSVFRSMIRTIVELAASLFATPAATAAGSAAVAVADGPLPIGDAIAVVCGAWTAYDVYSTRREFEREIKAGLTNALPEMKRNVHHQLMERIHSLQSDYQRAQDRIRNEMASTLAL